MEICPKCGLVSVERNHHTGLSLCYNRNCDYIEEEREEEGKDAQ